MAYIKKLWFSLKGYVREFLDNPHYQFFGEFYYRIVTNEKVVALTFDDGPNDPYTEKLLEVLDRHEIKSTFFFVGKNIERNFHIAVKVFNRGHQIANHSYTHSRLLYKSKDFIRQEIEKTDSLIRSIGVNYDIVFRAPYGSKFLMLPYVLWTLGKKHILFDFFPSPREWSGAPCEKVVSSILRKVRPGSIIVLHDGNRISAPLICEYTNTLIPRMKEMGYRFMRVDEILEYNKGN